LLLTSILAVLTAVLLLFFVLRLAQSPGAKVNLGDQEFNLGRDTLFAPKVTAHGPLIFAPLRGNITLYVQHLGDAPGKGWQAFGAHDPGQAPTCNVVWRTTTHTFEDPCNGAVYPATGVGLDQYPTRVDANGDVIVNLRQAVTPTTVTSDGAAPTVTTIPGSAPTTAAPSAAPSAATPTSPAPPTP
jgi:hypothetical protein